MFQLHNTIDFNGYYGQKGLIKSFFCIIMLRYLFSPLSHDESPLVIYRDILDSSANRSVISVDFSRAPLSSTLIRLHGFLSQFNFVRMKSMILNVSHAGAVWKIQSSIVLVHTTVIIAVKPQMELV